MGRWLVKEEPTHYSFADLQRDKGTEWSGVHNPLALRHLRSMVPEDPVFYYHTGSEKAIVGIAQVADAPRPDPKDDRGSWKVRIIPDRPLRRPISLATIKGDRAFAGFDLVRNSRLSVMPVAAPYWAQILRYEGSTDKIDRGSPTASRRDAAGRHSGSA